MKYQITFIQGENKGTKSLLIPNQALSIGRSHSNDICLQAPDVSGRHIIIRPGSGENIAIEVLSSRLTMLNKRSINIGDILDITVGDIVQMGEDTSFVLEQIEDETNTPSDDVKTTAPSCEDKNLSDDDATTANIIPHDFPHIQNVQRKETERGAENLTKREEISDPNETIAFQTRMASDDELDSIKKSFRNKHRLKILFIGLPIFLFFIGALCVYFYLKPVPEEYVSWPTDKQGEYLNEFQQVASYLALVYPKVPDCKVETKENTTTITTKIGKLKDVPLNIIVTTRADKSTLKQDHDTAFEHCLETMRNKSQTISLKGDKTAIFINESRGAGIPLSYVSYTRRFGNDDFFGYAVFLRNAENIHFIMMEVPIVHQWRAERFLRTNITSMIIYAIKRTPEHWEGTSSIRLNTSPTMDLEEAAHFMGREAPVYWGKIFYRIRSALIKATIANDKKMVADAVKMLVKLREQQSLWYSTQKLAYQYAERNDDRNSMQSIQATCDSIFSVEFQQADFRYDRIRRKDWK